MVAIDWKARRLTLTIIYEGPALGGKSTSLRHLHAITPTARRGSLGVNASETERQLSLMLDPAWVGPANDLTVRLQLRTVPGPVFYESAHKHLLAGVDGVVFVADSQEFREEANLDCLWRLTANLLERGLSSARMPLVLQYTKQDMDEVMTPAQMDAVLNPWPRPSFASVAVKGVGVVEPLQVLVTQVLVGLRGTVYRR